MQKPDDELIDAQLRRAFSPPPDAHFGEVASAVVAAPVAHRPRWPWIVAAAAAALVVALGLLRPQRGPEGHDGRQLAALWTAAYEHALDCGFGSAGCCAGDPDLAALCQRLCGTRLAFGGDGDGDVRLLGCYSGLPTGGCLALLLQVHGDPVCVFVVPRGNDPHPSLPPSASLTLSRRDLGPLVLYSLALDEEVGDVLAGFSVPRP